MSEANVLLQMTIKKSRLIEDVIVRFLGHIPSWKERKTFRIMNQLHESSIYFKGELIGTVICDAVEEIIV
ncbi:MAG: hypothetical protein ACXVMS_10510 [Flavisolibacter sp.]